MTAFDGQQFAADLGPGKPGHDADLVFHFGHAIAILRHAKEVVHVLGVILTFFFLPLAMTSSLTALRQAC
jgi:hypothetical protein